MEFLNVLSRYETKSIKMGSMLEGCQQAIAFAATQCLISNQYVTVYITNVA